MSLSPARELPDAFPSRISVHRVNPPPAKTDFVAAALDPIDRYKLLTGLVVPRPIGWIGSVDGAGVRNLAPFSFFNVVSGTPPTVLFSPGRRDGRPKDTLANVQQTREFTVNVVSEHVAEAMNATAAAVEPAADEFDLAGLTAAPGAEVGAPLVAEALANLECRVDRIVDLGDPPRNSVVFGTVLRIHVAEHVLDGTRVDPVALRAVGRMAGGAYTRTTDGYFEMERPP